MIHGKDVFADAAFADEASYYKAAAGTALGTAAPKAARDWDAGMAVYDITTPGQPRRIGFLPVSGGVHRIWYTGGRWAFVSALLDGYTDFIFMTVDMADPTNPRAMPCPAYTLRAARPRPGLPIANTGCTMRLSAAIRHGALGGMPGWWLWMWPTAPTPNW